ncbi:unnamed protein product [Lathyrus oleraceus]
MLDQVPHPCYEYFINRSKTVLRSSEMMFFCLPLLIWFDLFVLNILFRRKTWKRSLHLL